VQIAGLFPGEVELPRAVQIYRVTLPFSYLDSRSKHTAMWMPMFSFAAQLSNQQRNRLLDSDIIVLGRPIVEPGKANEMYKFLNFLRSRGAKLVYETDDDLTELYRDTSGGKNGTCIPYLSAVDAVTVTTEPLAELTRQLSDKPVYVLPNKVEHTYFAKLLKGRPRDNPDTFNVMLIGTPTHGDDWKPAYEAASYFLMDHPDARLLVGGFHPRYIADHDQVIRLPFVEYKDYPYLLHEADVVLAAIDPDDPFNHSKSAVKAMESWATVRQLPNGKVGGAAVIATDSVVYRDTVKHNHNGLLVPHTAEAYLDALELLYKDGHFRADLQRRGYLDCVKQHSIASGWQNWQSAYTRILRSTQ
jgi:glycosyltransferase involved in cell wall biosynthesis